LAAVHYDVPGVQQGPHNTCWLACFQMLIRFRVAVGRPVNALALALLDPALQSRFEERNLGMNPEAFERVARNFGLSAIHRPGLTRELRPGEFMDPYAPHDVLSRRGPFTLGIIRPNGGGHAVVFCGAEIDSPEFNVEIIDRRRGVVVRLSYPVFRRTYQADGGALFVF
jgi:hypothetical protein